MRLFLGLELPVDIKNKIEEEIQYFKSSDKGWEKAVDFHITLLFIGEVEDKNLDEIKKRLRKIQAEPFEITLKDFSFFSRRIFYLGVEHNKMISFIREQIFELFPEWTKDETKEFIPHVTLKRWQRYEYEELARLVSLREKFEVSFKLNKVSLFMSKKDEHGQRYHVIDSKYF